MTNYERIKQMSVDEMAYFISEKLQGHCTFSCPCDCSLNMSCEKAHKQWLESEAEE